MLLLEQAGLQEIHIDYAKAQKSIRFSDIISGDIEVVPLSNVDANGDYFYMASIDVFEKKGEHFFLFNIFNDGQLRVFDPQGGFVRNIGSRGNGLGQYLQAMDFSLTEEEMEEEAFRPPPYVTSLLAADMPPDFDYRPSPTDLERNAFNELPVPGEVRSGRWHVPDGPATGSPSTGGQGPVPAPTSALATCATNR
jgi:hypothetical protein